MSSWYLYIETPNMVEENLWSLQRGGNVPPNR